MKKSVLMSIQPYWVFLIIAHKKGWNIPQRKTVEVRKDYPKSPEWDKKTFIYCSKDKKSFKRIPKEYQPLMKPLLGKVVGEFVCNEILTIDCDSVAPFCKELDRYVEKETALTAEELMSYSKYICKGWHISELKVYDQPKSLWEFTKPCPKMSDLNNEEICAYCYETDFGEHKQIHTPDGVDFCEGRWCKNAYEAYKEENFAITRPPESWFYCVEA